MLISQGSWDEGEGRKLTGVDAGEAWGGRKSQATACFSQFRHDGRFSSHCEVSMEITMDEISISLYILLSFVLHRFPFFPFLPFPRRNNSNKMIHTLIRRFLQVRQPVRDFSWARLTTFAALFLVFWDGPAVEESTCMELPSFDSVGIGAEVSVASELGEPNDGVAIFFPPVANEERVRIRKQAKKSDERTKRNESYETCNENSAKWGEQYGRRAFNVAHLGPNSAFPETPY
jgi:hypothetical protein